MTRSTKAERLTAIRRNGGNIAAAARKLGMSDYGLEKWAKKNAAVELEEARAVNLPAWRTGGPLPPDVAALRKTLDAGSKAVFDRRIRAKNPVTLRELGEDLSLSRERVRQIEKNILSRLTTT